MRRFFLGLLLVLGILGTFSLNIRDLSSSHNLKLNDAKDRLQKKHTLHHKSQTHDHGRLSMYSTQQALAKMQEDRKLYMTEHEHEWAKAGPKIDPVKLYAAWQAKEDGYYDEVCTTYVDANFDTAKEQAKEKCLAYLPRLINAYKSGDIDDDTAGDDAEQFHLEWIRDNHPTRNALLFGIEYEIHTSALENSVGADPNYGDKLALAPNNPDTGIPYFDLDVDHFKGAAVFEAASGPLPLTDNELADVETAINSWAAPLDFTDQADEDTLPHLLTAYNLLVDAADGSKRFHLTVTDAKWNDVQSIVHPTANTPNYVQVNYEIPLTQIGYFCKNGASNWLSVFGLTPGMLRLNRRAAWELLHTDEPFKTRFAGDPAPDVKKQRARFQGLFSLFYYNVIFKGGIFTEKGDMGVLKNFYAHLVKSGVRTVTRLLSTEDKALLTQWIDSWATSGPNKLAKSKQLIEIVIDKFKDEKDGLLDARYRTQRIYTKKKSYFTHADRVKSFLQYIELCLDPTSTSGDEDIDKTWDDWTSNTGKPVPASYGPNGLISVVVESRFRGDVLNSKWEGAIDTAAFKTALSAVQLDNERDDWSC